MCERLFDFSWTVIVLQISIGRNNGRAQRSINGGAQRSIEPAPHFLAILPWFKTRS